MKEHINLWVHDTFYIDYVDSLPETWYDFRMEAASICKTNRDSVKIGIRLITLDSVVFSG